MLLAIDVGNSNIVIGVFEGDQLRLDFRLHTDERMTADEFGASIHNLLGHDGIDPKSITAVAISNVVPPLTPVLEQMVEKYFDATALMVGPGIRSGIRIHYDDPRQVGADRIVNAIAAHAIYGGPAIMVDFGTATTFDVIDEQGDYLGGAIAPGITSSVDALVSRAAKLSRVELLAPPSPIGRNTVASMQSGVVYGYVGLVEGIVKRMKAEVGDNAKVIATGGLAELFADQTKCIDHIDQNLTLIGLRLVYEMNM